MKKIIKTPNAPAAIGPYSQAVEINGTLFISGQVPVDPATGRIVEGDIRIQTEQVFRNIDAILTAAGFTFSEVVKSTCYLADISDFKAMNEVYAVYYPENEPARVTVAVKGLPLGAMIEIETVAVRKDTE